jgi:predicted  nucleic acid-binding Zn-ribbon protein
VVCGGGRAFRLRNNLGARYVNYLLHEPNVPISAFDLEVAIQPEKGEARCRNSIQPESDARALREYAQELRRLQASRERAQAAGNPEEVARLEGEIEAVEAALQGSSAADTGRRARDNVRKAVAVVMEQLRGGGPEERALVEHLEAHLSMGLECLYSQPDGRIWE